MPVKLGSKLPSHYDAEARIEIVPLIDIMFFLLAAFMLVSLSMVNMKSVKVSLPTATSADSEIKRDFLDVSIDKSGEIFLDKTHLGDNALIASLVTAKKSDADVKVFVSGDRDAHHGDVIHALDLVRLAGIDKVAFEIRPGSGTTP